MVTIGVTKAITLLIVRLGESGAHMRQLVAQRAFALLSVGQLVSRLGDVMLLIALPFFVYTTTGSVLATGATFAATSVPAVVFGPFAGAVADRVDARRLMIIVDIARAVAICGLFLVASG